MACAPLVAHGHFLVALAKSPNIFGKYLNNSMAVVYGLLDFFAMPYMACP